MPARGYTRKAYLDANAFELSIALLALIAALAFAIYPDDLGNTPVGRTFHPFDVLWNAAYGVSGLLIIIGLYRLRPRIELVGLIVFIGALTINAIAVASVGGTRGGFTIATFVAIAGGAVRRVRVIFRAGQIPEGGHESD